MGALVGGDDIYIGSLLELFNLRFGIEQDEQEAELVGGGITEMKALQDEFEIFKEGRPFVDSAKLLGLGGLQNNRAKNRWFTLLTWLSTIPSDTENESGDQRIVSALIKNFASKKPQPCFIKAHDSRDENGYGLKVVVKQSDNPIFYINKPYLTISLPMAPNVPPKKGKKKK